MARFCGKVGYFKTVETSPGIYEEEYIEKTYRGDVLSIGRTFQNGSGINDNIVLNNRISIVADEFAYQNFSYITYVEFMGTKWKVSNVEVQRPRLILSIGDVYNA